MPQLSLQRINPRDLLLPEGENIRTRPVPSQGLIDSIRDLGGLLQPVVARATEDGIVVRMGARRTLAAIEAGLDEIDVLITDAGDDEVRRIVEQWAENTTSEPLTVADQVAAVGRLFDLHVPAGQVGKRLALSRSQVTAARRAAGSDVAREALAGGRQLTLPEAGLLAEFDGTPSRVAHILEAIDNGWSLSHIAQRWRDDDKRAAAVDAEAARLMGEGAVIADPPASWMSYAGEWLDGDGQPFTAESHAACPGHQLVVGWNHVDDTVRVRAVCDDPDGHGHQPGPAVAQTRDALARRGAPDGPADGDAAGDAARAAAAEVRQLNRAWRSAATVRQEWVAALLARRAPPADALRLILAELAAGNPALTRAMERGHPGAGPMLGLGDSPDRSDLALALRAASDKRAVMLGLGLVLAAMEGQMGVETWRPYSPRQQERLFGPKESRSEYRYLAALAGWGYDLSDVERMILDFGDPAAPAAAAEPDDPGAEAGLVHYLPLDGDQDEPACHALADRENPVINSTTDRARVTCPACADAAAADASDAATKEDGGEPCP